MSPILFIITLILAIAATAACMFFIPRARHAPVFDAILWIASIIVAFLGGWLVLGSADVLPLLGTLAALQVAAVPIIPLFLGTFAGAVLLVGPLWVMDRFARPEETSDFEEDAETTNDAE